MPSTRRRDAATRLAALAALPLFLTAPARAQGGTELYLLHLQGEGTDVRVVSTIRMTDRAGYDNQPAFAPDGAHILFTSIRDGQADVYRYDRRTGHTTQLLATPESEYSPTPMPSGEAFSVVRVEADSTQRLWSFGMDGGDPTLLLPEVAPVGYHAWLNDTLVALFVLGDPATLRIANRATGRATVVAENIGRTLAPTPGTDRVSFLRLAEDERWITSYDPGTGAVEHLQRPVGQNEFFGWLPSGTLVMGEGSKLFVADPVVAAGWVEVADLAPEGIAGITRVAVSPGGDWMVVVGEERR